jgi:hypothetical protein
MNRTVYSSVGEAMPLAFTGDDPRAYVIVGCIMGSLFMIVCIAVLSCVCRSEACMYFCNRQRVAVVVPEPIHVVIVPEENDRSEIYNVRD